MLLISSREGSDWKEDFDWEVEGEIETAAAYDSYTSSIRFVYMHHTIVIATVGGLLQTTIVIGGLVQTFSTDTPIS